MRRVLVAAFSTIALLLSAACGGTGAERPPTRTADNGDRINQADIEFATDMIVLNAQSLQLVNMLRDHTTSPRLVEVGERILTELVLQTEQLVTWITDWGVPIPETPLDHANAGHEGDGDHGDGMKIEGNEMPGLLSSEQVEALERLAGDVFDRQWIEHVVSQRQGAIVIAERVVRLGVFQPLLLLARDTQDEQRAKIGLVKGE